MAKKRSKTAKIGPLQLELNARLEAYKEDTAVVRSDFDAANSAEGLFAALCKHGAPLWKYLDSLPHDARADLLVELGNIVELVKDRVSND